MSASPSIGLIFLAYTCVLFLIAGVAFRATKTQADYVLGGRNLHGPVTAMGVSASDMSSWLMLGLPGAVYLTGLNQIWIAVGLLLGAFLNWRLVALRLRLYTEIAGDALTIPAYFENRFHDTSHVLRVIIALIILFFFTFYSAAGFVGGGLLFATSFNVSYLQGLYICGLIVVLYTSIGGFFAINWIDLFQGLLMLLALLILPTIAINHLGGISVTIDLVKQIDTGYLQIFRAMDWLAILSLLAWGLGYMGQPHILMRFMAAHSHRDITIAWRISLSWMFLALSGAVLVGFVGIAFFHAAPLSNQETVFLEMTKSLFFVGLAGLCLAAVLSAIMSTVSAQLLACSSALAEDGYHIFINRRASQQSLVWVGRLAVILVAAAAFALAYNPNSNILGIVSYAWAGLGAAFGPPLLISLYWRKMTRTGALLGMLTGAGCVIIWNLLAHRYQGPFRLYEILPAFFLSCVSVFIGSHIGKKADEKILKEFDTYQNTVIQSYNKQKGKG